MQYLLTQDEYDELVARAQTAEQQAEAILFNLCKEVADHKPVVWGWSRHEEPKPWGCIESRPGEWHCDSCPVRNVCPNDCKQWSK